jgi:beta-lactamase regulating signal transducer with metallopeptidase domain
MNDFLSTVVSNSLVAAGLAVLLMLLARFRANPALVHALLLLVFVKLFTPPLVSVDISPTRLTHVESLPEVVVVGALAHSATQATSQTVPLGLFSLDWQVLFIAVWGLGIIVTVVIAGLRIMAFRWLLRRATKNPAYPTQIAKRLCARMRVASVPEILVLPARITPAVWSVTGRPCIILPEELVQTRAPERLEAIIAHELSHIRRRDHLVRLLKFVTTTVFWWNPVVWYVFRQLRELEEVCCDAMVLEMLSAGACNYAIALIETVEFLSQGEGRLPMGATAAKPSVSLYRRIEMLKTGTTPRRLTVRHAVLAVCLLSAPMLLTFAVESPSSVPLVAKVYDLGFLRGNAKQIEAQVRKQVEPQQWAKAGGPFSLRRTASGHLVVSASPAVHEQIDIMLELRELSRRQGQLTAKLNRLRGRGAGMGGESMGFGGEDAMMGGGSMGMGGVGAEGAMMGGGSMGMGGMDMMSGDVHGHSAMGGDDEYGDGDGYGGGEESSDIDGGGFGTEMESASEGFGFEEMMGDEAHGDEDSGARAQGYGDDSFEMPVEEAYGGLGGAAMEEGEADDEDAGDESAGAYEGFSNYGSAPKTPRSKRNRPADFDGFDGFGPAGGSFGGRAPTQDKRTEAKRRGR